MAEAKKTRVKKVEEPKLEETVIEQEPVIEQEVSEVVEEKLPPVIAATPIPTVVSEELSNEDKILNYIESRGMDEVRLNDFLKTIYGVPKLGEPPLWLSQATSKKLKALLSKMQEDKLINVVNSQHLRLGTFYYEDNKPETKYHTLNTVSIVVKK